MIITSWDDYSEENYRLADLLKKYGLPGIFFIECAEKHKLEQITRLDKMGFEIGGHTLSHPADLKILNESVLRFEVAMAKKIVETTIYKTIRWFAYPRGRFNEAVKNEVGRAGFQFGRTTRLGWGGSDYEKEGWHCFNRREYDGKDWLEYLKEVIDVYDPNCAGNNQNIHIWGHAWEINKNNDWDKLEELFAYLKGRIIKK